MTQKEFLARLCEVSGVSREDVRRVMYYFRLVLFESLYYNGKVVLPKIGTFRRFPLRIRNVRNISTGEGLEFSPGAQRVSFRASKALKKWCR